MLRGTGNSSSNHILQPKLLVFSCDEFHHFDVWILHEPSVSLCSVVMAKAPVCNVDFSLTVNRKSLQVTSSLESLKTQGNPHYASCADEKAKSQRSWPCLQAHTVGECAAMWAWSAFKKFQHHIRTFLFFLNWLTYQGRWSSPLWEVCGHIKNTNLPVIKVCFALVINSLSL